MTTLQPSADAGQGTLSSQGKSFARTRSPFYVIMAVAALAVVLAGFSPTYIVPMANHTFNGPLLVHVHGALFFGWILLGIVQPLLIRFGKVRTHRRIGYVAAGYAVLMVIAGVTLAIYAAKRNTAAGIGDDAKAFLLTPLSDMVLFTLFMALAVYNRRDGEAHKRLILLATTAILPAAFARFLGVVGISNLVVSILIIDSFVFIGMLYDYLSRRRIHKIYLWGGLLLIVVHTGRLFAAYIPGWRAIADWIVGV